MKSDNRDPFARKDRDIFQLPNRAMSDEVTDAARLLRSFVSQVEIQPEDSEAQMYTTSEPDPYEGDPFSLPSSAAPVSKASIGPEDSGLVDLMEQASHVSNTLTDAMEFVPRVVEGNSGVFSLHPKEELSNSLRHPPIRLRYKGKATKKQLERLRQRVLTHAQNS